MAIGDRPEYNLYISSDNDGGKFNWKRDKVSGMWKLKDKDGFSGKTKEGYRILMLPNTPYEEKSDDPQREQQFDRSNRKPSSKRW